MNDNRLLGNKIAKIFNKKNGVITYSGTLALEISLINLKLKKNSIVLVSSLVCYSIINTIKKLNLIPLIVVPKNYFSLTDEDVDNALKKYEVKCILLVHQYGIINTINKQKYKNKNLKIIEDVAQCFDIDNNYYPVGLYSDYVITSFGKTKPLSYGIGGAVLSDLDFDNIDYYDNESRENDNILLSYSYPLSNEINYKELINIGKKNIKEQRNNSKYYINFFKNTKYTINDNLKNCFHRFIVLIDNYDEYLKIVEYLKINSFEFQTMHSKELIDLDKFKDSLYINNNEKKYYILIRTRNIDLQKQKEVLKHLKEMLFNSKCDIV